MSNAQLPIPSELDRLAGPTPANVDLPVEPSAGLTEHVYDGIREYDNPTPAWWTWVFLVSIAFSVVYFFFVTLAGGELSPEGFYKRDQIADSERMYALLGNLEPDAKTLVKFSRDGGWVKYGEGIFKANCAACHGPDGQGLSGPNLTDNAYLHVKKIDDVFDVVTKGRNNGAMPPWPKLTANDRILVSAFVASLRGKNLPGPRPAEGTVPPPWSDGVAPK
jgi:cytochrome c oxidase cbb3-type subunit III